MRVVHCLSFRLLMDYLGNLDAVNVFREILEQTKHNVIIDKVFTQDIS